MPGVLTWTAIFVWLDRREHTRANGESLSDPNKEE
jgi:hypothetical protein